MKHVTASAPETGTPIGAPNAHLLEHQLRLMCRLSPSALWGGIVVAALMAWVVAVERQVAAICWFAGLVAISFARMALHAYFLRHAAKLDIRAWRNWILFGLALNGFVWAIPEIWFVPQDSARQTVLGLLAVGIAATAISSLATVPYAYEAFLLPFMLPIAISYLPLDENSRMVGIGIVLFVLAMLRISQRHRDTISGLLRLQIDLQTQIAQRERTEAELRVAKAQAEAANHAKSLFLANVSHELRTPLNGVLGMAELLMRETSGKQLRRAETIRKAGLRLLRIINDLLDLARLEAGALQIVRSEFAPHRLTTETVELMQEPAGRKGLALTVDIDAAVAERAVSDPGRIQQVLTNLVDNAVKFTERGFVEVRLTSSPTETTDEPRMKLRWEVRDTGPGIPVESQDRLFKAFSQLDPSATRRHGGVGLGLAISRQIAEALNGSIGVTSAPGTGSTFWFEIPVTLPVHAPELAAPATASPTGRQGRILIVEDNATNRELVAEVLQSVGYTAVTATNGEEALARLSSEEFDLVLMDWHMPVLDGLTATRRWRAIERAQGRARIPVVAVTASVQDNEREACLAAGMDDFLAKPFTGDGLLAMVDRWVRSTR